MQHHELEDSTATPQIRLSMLLEENRAELDPISMPISPNSIREEAAGENTDSAFSSKVSSTKLAPKPKTNKIAKLLVKTKQS